MRVRKAIIPAAGFGTRLLPASKSQAKEMLPVVDKPLIQYTVEEAVGAGLGEIGIVTSRGKSAMEDHFDSSPELEAHLREKNKLDLLEEMERISRLAKISFIRQPRMLGLGHAILMGESFAAGEPVAALTPDDIYDCVVPCIKQLVDVFEEKGGSVIVLGRVDKEGTKKYGIIRVKRQVSDRIFEAIRNTPVDARGEIQITDAIRVLLNSQPVYGVLFEGTRYDCGNKQGYVEGTIALALKHPELGGPVREFIRSVVGK